jgi:hypothetical protein
MPWIEFYQNKATGDVVMCSLVFCKELGGGNAATGPLVHIPADEFAKNCADFVAKEFDLFYTREYGVKSELYNDMSKSERRKFMSQHRRVIISWLIETKPVNVYIGGNAELYGKIDFPFEKSAFVEYVLGAFAKAG